MPEDFQNNSSSNPKPPKRRKNEEFNWNRVFKVVLGWSAILFGFFLIMIWSKSGDGGEVEIGFDQYQRLLNENKIKEAIVKKLDNTFTFHGVLKAPEPVNVGSRQVTSEKIAVLLPYTNIDDAVIKTWNEKNIAFKIEKEDTSWIGPLIGALPWILIIVFWIVIMRRMQGQGGGTKGIFSFGNRVKLLTENQLRVTLRMQQALMKPNTNLKKLLNF
jgi:cell division protease FtsH